MKLRFWFKWRKRKAQEESNIETPYSINLPTLPRQVDRSAIKANGKLLDDETLRKAAHHPNLVNPPYKLRRERPAYTQGPEFSILRIEEENYILYSGKHEKALGAGSFGKVKLAQRASDGKWFAIKRLQNQPGETAEETHQELRIEKENIKQTGQDAKSLIRATQQREKNYLLMELAEGIPMNKLKNLKALPNIRRIQIATNTLEAINSFHEQGLLHRDIKPHNLVANLADNSVSVVDLGLAQAHKDKVNYDANLLGTPDYQAPELILQADIIKAINEIVAIDNAIQEIEQTKTHQNAVLASLQITNFKIKAGESARKANKLIDELKRVYHIAFDVQTCEIRYDEASEVYALGATLENHFQDSKTDSTMKKVHTLIKNMQNQDPSKRPTLNQAIKVLKKQKNKFLKSLGELRKVAIVDSQDLLQKANLNPNYLNTLKKAQYDGIYIYDHNNTIMKTSNANMLIHELHQHGIFVQGIISPKSDGSPPNFDDIKQQIETTKNKNINVVHYPKAKPNNISEINFDKVIENLNKEEDRLYNEYRKLQQKMNLSWLKQETILVLQYRMSEIENKKIDLKRLHSSNSLDYDTLKKELKKLQKEMLHTNFIKRFLHGLLPQPGGAKAIDELLKEIKPSPRR